ncbi:MAG: LysM peptidoglycan-binding domain-containing protein [Oscillospiraceae bacterium]|nr:LysM peptidoglycan-binding domain-containing protein [Oscillospiraceae bacterium]
MSIHVVSAGQTVSSIAAQYGVSPVTLARLNELPPGGELAVGQALVVQFPTQTHTVTPGETLFGIARRYGVTVRSLYRNNFFLHGQSVLRPGEELTVSLRAPTGNALTVGGYAYPSISRGLLDQQLPYLTDLMPFTCGVTPEGTLLPLADEALLTAARRQQAQPRMSLSTLTADGGFSRDDAAAVLTDPERTERLVQAVADAVLNRDYAGVDVDFEYLGRELAQPFVAFITSLHRRLAPSGKTVWVALPPKTGDDQPGQLYEGHDYAALGAAADAVLLMTYEWGYTYSEPRAVAPLPQVEQVLRYALSRIPAEKLLLGLPTYGYAWELPYREGTAARSLSPQEAVALARTSGAAIQYDETAQSPWFRCRIGSTEHEVWFEDARSAQAKLTLVGRYGLRGVGLWNLMRLFPQLCLLLNQQFADEM